MPENILGRGIIMKVAQLPKRIIITMLVIGLICTIASIIYYRSVDFLPFLFGIILGLSVSIAKVFLLIRTIDKVVTMEQKQAAQYASLQHLFRLFISGAALMIGAIFSHTNLWGVIAGILSFQVAIYVNKGNLKDDVTKSAGVDQVDIKEN